MRRRKLSARIFMLGCRSMKPDTLPAKISITTTATIMATTMIGISGAIPTAVITESSENTISSSRI
jgi:hypothetical protein